jgi:hypothetical protein
MRNQFDSTKQDTDHIEPPTHTDATRDDETSSGRDGNDVPPAQQEAIRTNGTDIFYNVIVAEGPTDTLRELGDELRQSFPAVAQISTEEASRHRDWLKSELGGFCSADRGHPVAAWSFESEPIRSLAQALKSASLVRSITASAASRGLIVGYVGIDTQRDPIAAAVALCSDSSTGLIGSLGNNRYNYFRVMQHCFYKDSSVDFAKALVEGRAIGPVPYVHRVQWSESDSPLRLEFRTEDPLRNGQSLSPNLGEGEDGAMIVANGFLPPEGTSVNVHMAWRKAYTVIRRAWECGVEPYFDDDAQLMVSGYGLFGAGVIDNRLQLTGPIDAREDADNEAGLTEETARANFMRLYAGLLAVYLDDHDVDTQARVLATDHLKHATEWLVENGHVLTFAPASAAIN